MKRAFQIFFGGLLIVIGVLALATPGPGILIIVIGITLISPYHGRRIVWRIRCGWRWLKSWYYSFRFRRTEKRSKFLKSLKRRLKK